MMKISKENIHFAARERATQKEGRPRIVVATGFACLVLLTMFAIGSYRGRAEPLQPSERSARETISYGSRVGMTVTVTEKSGIDSPAARISGAITEADVRSYCIEYVRDPSQGCVKEHIADSSIAKSIFANCNTGVFSDFYGGQYRYLANGELHNFKTGEALGDSEASGRSYLMAQLRALCPSAVSATKSSQQMARPAERVVAGRQVTARSSGVLRGAIICPDLQSVRLLQAQNAQHWEETSQDKLTRGQSQMIRGQATPPPDFAALRCALILSGSVTLLETDNPVPVVTAVLPNGATIRGVTFPYMYGNGNSRSPF